MMRRVLLLLCAMASAAQAQQYLPFKNMSTAANPFRFYVDARVANPAGLQLGAVASASEAAWSTWNALSCAVPKASYAGLSTAVPIPHVTDSHDIYNVTPVWVETMGDPTYTGVFGSQSITAISLPLTYAGELQNCDTYLNAVDFDWTTDGVVANKLDVETVLLHEAGHCLGLDHFFAAGGNVMQSTVTPGVSRRALAPIDADALCMRYPSMNAVGDFGGLDFFAELVVAGEVVGV